MKRPLAGDWVLASCALVGALVYLYFDLMMKRSGMAGQVGPAAFPALVGGGLLLSAGLYLLENLRKAASMQAPAPSDPDARHHRLALLGTLVWTLGYYLVFEPAGYLVATSLFIFGLLAYFHRGRWAANLVIAIGFALVVYMVFAKLLHVSLPKGLLSF